jgi:hypothetical protein
MHLSIVITNNQFLLKAPIIKEYLLSGAKLKNKAASTNEYNDSIGGT